ncbi:MAG: hypothetical protein Q8O59_02155 [bacterium]|nr:hypothetical protein [bacterium]
MIKKLTRLEAELTKTSGKKQKSGKEIKITYNQIKASQKVIDEHLDKVFDILFREVYSKKYDQSNPKN